MKPKTLMLLVFAGGCGLVAMLFVQRAMQGQAQAKVETSRVLVAIADIDVGVKLSEVNVAFREMPVEGLPKDVITTPEGYIERSPRSKIFTGDVVNLVKLNEPGVSGRSVSIPKGMRVLAINVDDRHTNSGLLQPGDRVDVQVTYQGRDQANGRITKVKTLLEYVEVFATDDRMINKTNDGSESGKAKNVSLLLTPEQATFVNMAATKGQLSLLWRNKADDEIVQANNVDEELLDELEGTAGFGDPLPLYRNGGPDDLAPEEPTDSVASDRTPKEPTASEFLDKAEQPNTQADQPASTEVAAAIAPEKPKWVMQIHSGKQVSPFEFELPEEPAPAATQAGGSIGGLIKSFWGSGQAGETAAPITPQ